MRLAETVKNFLRQPAEITDTSSEVSKDKTINDLTNQDLYPQTGAFFDDENHGVYGQSDKADKLEKQKSKIMSYRQLAKTPDVNDALEEIINEIIFTFDDKSPLKISIDEENKKIEDAITEKYNKILKLINVKRNLYSIVKTAYIDGQIILHHPYAEKNTKEGIKSIKIIEPVYFYLDTKKNVYKYYERKDTQFYQNAEITKGEEYSIEEITREDFGLYESGINLGYLEFALKTANQLRTLEDLLIPMRFSRSISRRVFNVDIGDLPNRKGEEVMREMQGKFKYKKFYNVSTGEVTNQQHVTSMVEDYWFANRSGGKGTQVDVIDETGNLGEINDILYFNKKLYKSMFIPSNRISINPDEDKSFDFESTTVTKEDVKFFMFVSRLRVVYTSLFKEMLKKEVISCGIMSEIEWDEYEEKIEISFVNENTFIEKMNLDNFMSRLDIYATAQEYQGKLFSAEYILKNIFRLSDEEIKERMEEIQAESKDPLFANFYKSEDDEQQW